MKNIFIIASILLTQQIVFAQSLFINEVLSANSAGLKDEDGEYVDWIEIYNSSSSQINLFGYHLSDDSTDFLKWTLPDVTIQPNGFLIVFASGKDRSIPGENLHTNFKISSSGESIFLVNSSSSVIDSRNAVTIPADISFGRKPDGSSSWFYFYQPTPAASNNTEGFIGITSAPQFSLQGGFYPGSVSITLSASTAGAEIYYTTGGSIPSTNSNHYLSAININNTTVIKARAFSSGMIESPVIVNSYLINEQTTLLVVSVSTDPANLWDNDFGIYVLGDSAEVQFPYYGANFWQD